jgi:acylphosphatase
MIEARRVHIEGRVQGVGFRWSAMSEARRLGLDGWVRNTAGGDVEVFFQGEAGSVEAMVTWLGEGPSAASVRDLRVEDASPDGSLDGFEIRG